MKISMFLLIILLFTLTCFGQSWQVVQQSPSVMLMDLCFLADGQNGWAVGGALASTFRVNTVLHTTNGGLDWEAAAFPAGMNTVLQGIYFVTADSGWVVGTDGAIYSTDDGGANWTAQSSGTMRLLARVHFINSVEGWVTGGWQDGSAYLVLHTTDGGTSWQDQSFGSGVYSCESIFFADASNGWIGGRDNTLAPHIHHTTDGGMTWTRQTLNLGTSNIGIASIKFAGGTRGWAAVTSIYVSGPVLHTEDGGETWDAQYTTGLHYHVLDVRDSLHVAIVGTRILPPAQTSVFTTSNGGTSWSSHNPPVAAYTYGIQYRGNDIWLASDQSQILKSADNGNSWYFQHRAPLLKSIGWSTHSNGWAVAGTSAGTDGSCSHSTDAGQLWEADTTAPGGARVQWVDSAHGFMLWEGTNASLWRTTDAGGSWSQHFVGTGNWIGGVFFATPDSGWAYGSNGTIRNTTNGGVSWAAQNSATTRYVEGLTFINSQEGWAGGGYGGANGFIQHTADGGALWEPQTPALTSHVWDVFFLDRLQGWASTVGGQVQKTTDGGVTWVPTGGINNDYAEKLYMQSPMVGWLVGRNAAQSGGQGFIYRTNNGGDSWALEWTGLWPNSAIMDIAVQPGGDPWACGNHNTILAYQSPNTAGEIFIPHPSSLILSSYPNPFNSRTVVSYTLSHTAHVSLDVYDLLGRRVATLASTIQDAGMHRAEWNAEGIGSGIYICKLQTEGFSAAQKIVLLR